MQENRQHTHKIVTQDIPWETLIEGKKPSLQKHPSPCIIQQKHHCNTTMEAFMDIATTEQTM